LFLFNVTFRLNLLLLLIVLFSYEVEQRQVFLHKNFFIFVGLFIEIDSNSYT